MYYFFMDRNFNLDKYDFDIIFSPRLTKIERDLLNLFLDKVDKKDEFTEIEYSSNMFNMTYAELIEAIKNIKEKSLTIELKMEGKAFRTLFINFFDIIFFEDNKVIYKLSHEFSIAGNTNNFFNRINLLAFLRFDNIHFFKFYKIILKNYKFSKEITFSLKIEELKNILSIPKDSYNRFYDLETKVLNPILKDLAKIDLPVYIEKIKDKKGKGSSVLGIKIKIINTLYVSIDKDTNRLLKEYSDFIENFIIAYENIFLLRKINTYEKCKDYIKSHLDSLSNEDFLTDIKK